MSEYTLIAASSFGLESVVAHELKRLGYGDLTVENGKVTFSGGEEDIARCNLWLRAADRVLIKVAEFEAHDFDELFDGTARVGWPDMIPVDGKMHVTGKSVQSQLASVSDCQSIVKKAIVESMKKRHRRDWFDETGPIYKIEISLLKNRATLTIDTTGPGLHKRGYRSDAGEAPLRETLAAGLVLLSRWTPDRVLADPLCGSGTIAIEAALIGKNMAPGLNRSFVSEGWGQIPKKVWDRAREEARSAINRSDFRVLASDSDAAVLKKARANADHAGVEDSIALQRMAVSDFRSHKKYGCIICNPPYGLRMGEERIVEALYRSMGEMYRKLDSWSMCVLTAHPDFQKFFGRKADRNRKLYNGDIKCYYYQYTGGSPPRIPRAESV